MRFCVNARMKQMTSKERMLAIIKGNSVDRVPFVQYDWMAPNNEVSDLVGRNNVGILGWREACSSVADKCAMESREFDKNGIKHIARTLVTPKGNLSELRPIVPAMPGLPGFSEHFVKTIEDYEILLCYLQSRRFRLNTEPIDEFNAKTGDQGLPHVFLPRTPFQALWIEWVSLEDLAWHMNEAGDLLDEVMRALGDELITVAEITASAAGKSEFYHAVIGDNITAPIIGRNIFRKWCLPYYKTTHDILADAGIALAVHMDGELKGLWEEIDEATFDVFDSFSPPPDNDTPVDQALDRWPDKLIWANFPSSVHLQEASGIHGVAADLLRQAGHTGRFWIQISEDMPPGAWKTSYPEIVRAIEEFGKP
jgi:hypothetical protein